MDFFNSDVFRYEIIKYLTGRDVLNVQKAELVTSDQTNILLIEIIMNKLKDIFGNFFNDFLNLLKNRDIGVTGSFILSCIDGKNYYDDIDICANIKNGSTVMSFIDDTLKYELESSDIQPNYNYDMPINDWWESQGLDFIDTVLTVSHKHQDIPYDCLCKHDNTKECPFHVSTLNVTNLQFILVKCSMKEYINTFDINVCKNLFYWDAGFKLDSKVLDSIYNKKMDINMKNNVTVPRINKYFKRGFTIQSEREIELEILKYLLKEKSNKKLFIDNECIPFNYKIHRVPCQSENCYIEKYLSGKYKHKHIINLERLNSRQINKLNEGDFNYSVGISDVLLI